MEATAANISPAHVAAFRASAQLCATKIPVVNPQIFNLMMRLPDECTAYITHPGADLGVQLAPGVFLAKQQDPSAQTIPDMRPVSQATGLA